MKVCLAKKQMIEKENVFLLAHKLDKHSQTFAHILQTHTNHKTEMNSLMHSLIHTPSCMSSLSLSICLTLSFLSFSLLRALGFKKMAKIEPKTLFENSRQPTDIFDT